MPEVVATYIETKDLNHCQQLIDDLINSIRTDFAKYRKKTPASRLNEVFQAVVFQSGQKFVYSKACVQATHYQVKEALQLLIMSFRLSTLEQVQCIHGLVSAIAIVFNY